MSSARNRGIAEAAGEYIWFIDADDDIEPESIPLILQQIDCEAPDCLVFDYRFLWTETKQDERKEGNAPPNTRKLGREEILREIVIPTFGYSRESVYQFFRGEPFASQTFLCGGVVWNLVIKRSLIEKHELSFSTKLISCEDGMFVLRLFLYASEATAIYTKLYNYYYRVTGSQRRIREQPERLFANKMALVRERQELAGLYKEAYGRDFSDCYVGSLFFSAMELCIKLSRDHYSRHLRMFLEYVSSEPVRVAVSRIDVSRAPLKYKLPVSLLVSGHNRLLFSLVYVAWRLGAQRLFKKFTAG